LILRELGGWKTWCERGTASIQVTFEADKNGNIELSGSTSNTGSIITAGSDYTDGKGTHSTYSFSKKTVNKKQVNYFQVQTRITPSEQSVAFNLDIGVKPAFSIETTLGTISYGGGEAVATAVFKITLENGKIVPLLVGANIVYGPTFEMNDVKRLSQLEAKAIMVGQKPK
jgi:hypothetical protein